jgi:hypothetical protein
MSGGRLETVLAPHRLEVASHRDHLGPLLLEAQARDVVLEVLHLLGEEDDPLGVRTGAEPRRPS